MAWRAEWGTETGASWSGDTSTDIDTGGAPPTGNCLDDCVIATGDQASCALACGVEQQVTTRSSWQLLLDEARARQSYIDVGEQDIRQRQTCVSGMQAVVLAGCLLDPSQPACQAFPPSDLYLFNLPLCPDTPIQPVPPCLDNKALYTRDLNLPGMLYAKVLASPYARARILHLDTRKAEEYPGVRAILSAELSVTTSVGPCGGGVITDEAEAQLPEPANCKTAPMQEAVDYCRENPSGQSGPVRLPDGTMVPPAPCAEVTFASGIVEALPYCEGEGPSVEEKKKTALMVGGIVAGVIVAGGLGYLLLRKKRK